MTSPTVTGDHAGRPTDYTPIVLASGQANAECIQDGSSAALTCLHESQIVAVAFERRFVRTTGGCPSDGLQPCLRAGVNTVDGAPCVAIAFAHQAGGTQTTLGYDPELGTAPTLAKCQTPAVHAGMQVRRLTPRECERLMGFPDDWTRIPWRGKPAEDCPDGPRYKACGNSMGVNVMRWIGTRIQEVESQK